ncbi:sugar-binding domain-containing protein [Bifidobacterium sp. ESL0790]|uniref:sugar-binding transcriptional regulator n=1 Tax=Bifidobacterium sp. ESL0790 TaxID=2983233 RepID=UPI0023F96964|nr:sugar-binding domain-containing protein [Bifidobacterium sp. ESL0790]WEV72026.1 sigma factor-like helix-turn-helix DNA-binding protein [Bifidobacterium sp. ESL0790]
MAMVAELYWVENMKVESIGHKLGISRSTVSRLLSQARKHHVVEFKIRHEDCSTTKMENALNERYHVYAQVVPTAANADKTMREQAVGRAAATLLDRLVRPNMVLGVTWGRTIEALSLNLNNHPVRGVQILQLHGFGDSLLYGEDYVTQILTRFGNAFDASVHLLPMPAIFDSEHTRQLMYQERSIRRLLTLRDNLDLIITSVGSREGPKPSPLFAPGMLTNDDLKQLEKDKVVGNLASTFFRADGSTEDVAINRRSTGLTHREIFKVPIRLFIAGDSSKAKALLVTLRSGFVTHLVVDQSTAEQLLPSPKR